MEIKFSSQIQNDETILARDIMTFVSNVAGEMKFQDKEIYLNKQELKPYIDPNGEEIDTMIEVNLHYTVYLEGVPGDSGEAYVFTSRRSKNFWRQNNQNKKVGIVVKEGTPAEGGI